MQTAEERKVAGVKSAQEVEEAGREAPRHKTNPIRKRSAGACSPLWARGARPRATKTHPVHFYSQHSVDKASSAVLK
jgi:hypothetical protein